MNCDFSSNNNIWARFYEFLWWPFWIWLGYFYYDRLIDISRLSFLAAILNCNSDFRFQISEVPTEILQFSIDIRRGSRGGRRWRRPTLFCPKFLKKSPLNWPKKTWERAPEATVPPPFQILDLPLDIYLLVKWNSIQGAQYTHWLVSLLI